MPIIKTLSPVSGDINIVQITDSHLGIEYGDTLLNMNSDEGLADVLALINQHESPDLVLATGDIGNYPSEKAYKRFADVLDKSISAPMCWIPGNHDDPDLMAAARGEPYHQIIECGAWQLIMLNSRMPGKTHGHLDESELAFLASSLSESKGKHVMVCLHHQPVPIGSAWMDSYIVDNAQDFWAALDPFDHVKAVVWGHVHQAFHEQHKGIELISTPSTCIQFIPNQDAFGVDKALPGYRWFTLKQDGTIETGVRRVPAKDYGIDFDSQGY